MPKSKPKRRRSAPHERPYVSDLELRDALEEKLTERELNALNRQIQTLVQKTGLQIAKEATEEAYKRQFAVMMRVMRDRFGFGRKRLRRLWDACLEYIHDIDDGLLNTEEMLACLKNEDGIVISWEVKI